MDDRSIRYAPTASLHAHSQADLVPKMRPQAWRDLLADIKAHGVRVPLEVDPSDRSVILDGKHRWQAASELRIPDVPIVDALLAGDTPRDYMVKMAVLRRHLSDDQRATLAALWKHSASKQGQRTDLNPELRHDVGAEVDVGHPTRQMATSIFNISRRDVDKASSLLSKDPNLFQAVHQGEKSLNEAWRSIVRQPQERPPLPAGVFSVVYADPPWPYDQDFFAPARDHYPTMSMDDICRALPAEKLADNAVLFLWVTNAFLPNGLQVAERWGFAYCTNLVWRKTSHSAGGFYFHNVHELLFLCVRGSFPANPAGSYIQSVFDAPVIEHSRKPDKAYEIIEALYPGAAYLEMFARRQRKGWTSWGAEATDER